MTGSANAESAQPIEARIEAGRQRVEAAPDDIDARIALAELLLVDKQLEEAFAAYRGALTVAPDDTRARAGMKGVSTALMEQGRQLMRAGSLDAAERVCQQSLAANSDNAEAWLVKGVVHYQRKQSEQALKHWQRAAALAPDLADAHQNIGVFMLHRQRTEEAISAFHRALEADPGRDYCAAILTKLLTDDGRYEEAEEISTALLAHSPGAVETTAARANLLERRGSVREAFDFLQPVVAGGTMNPRIVNAFGKACHRLKPTSDAAIPHLERLIADEGLPRADRIRTLTTLAQLCDATDRYDEALRYLKTARELDSIDMGVVRQRIQFVESARTHYTRERLDSLPHGKNHSPIPIFVVGMPRSGTTLTEQILTAHPQAFGAGELTHVGKLVVSGFGTKKSVPAYFEDLDQARVDRLSRELLSTLLKLAPNTRRVVDKMPLNFLHLGAIELLLPGARIIHCTRHPLDTCISIFFNDFAESLPYTRKFETLGQYYRSYAGLMRHWQATVRLPIFELNYESLVADPEAKIREMLAFCGLDWDDACLNFSQQRRHVDTPSYHQVRQPLYSRSVGRYKHYKDGLGELITALGDVLDDWPD